MVHSLCGVAVAVSIANGLVIIVKIIIIMLMECIGLELEWKCVSLN